MATKLENYLRTHRKRAGLTQDEVAFLLGSVSGTKVSRYETYARRPTLETALAYEAIFRVPARELFAGLYERVERDAAERALALAARLGATKADKTTARKLAALIAITGRIAEGERHERR